MPKFSIEFDGVLTDVASLDLEYVDRCLFLWPERSVDYFRPRLGARQIVALLMHFGDVLITTSRPSQHIPKIRRWLDAHAPELCGIKVVSSERERNSELIFREKIKIHIGNSLYKSDLRHQAIINWTEEGLPEILTVVVEELRKLMENGLMSGYEYISSLSLRSKTPTFLVRRTDFSSKLRLFPDEKVVYNVRQFYNAAADICGSVVLPHAISWSPLSMETKFVEGKMAVDLPSKTRRSAIPALAKFLSALHEATSLNDAASCIVSCAVDRFNVCISSDQFVFLVDVCDNTFGSRWMDLIWTEQLYCDSHDEKSELVREYISNTKARPSSVEISEALRDYYSWLHYIVASGRAWNVASSDAVRAANEIARLRSKAPNHSALMSIIAG